MNINTKKIIAREILILTGILILTIVFALFLHIRNYYYNNLIETRKSLIIELKEEKEGFPKNRIWDLYHNGLSDELIVNYEIQNEKYAVPKKRENAFLSTLKNAKKLPNYRERYSLFRDSIYMFDYIEYSEFKELLRDSVYRNLFYDFASKAFDMGTKSEYEDKLNEGLLYNKNTEIKISENQKKILVLQKEQNKFELSILSYLSIYSKTLYFGLVILILAIPLRLFILLIKWSINTLKNI